MMIGHKLPDGPWPVMLTPFNGEGAIDTEVLERYTKWLIDGQSAGLFAVALTGEMFDLNEEERLSAIRVVVDAAGKKVPVAAAVPAAGSTGQSLQQILRVREAGADIVVLVVSSILRPEQPDQDLIDLVDEALMVDTCLTLGIYECPLPYHRLLKLETIETLGSTGRVCFFKETSHDLEMMADRVVAGKGALQVFNAGIENYAESLEKGVSGLSGWVVSVAPDLVEKLTGMVRENGLTEEAIALQQLLIEIEHQMGSTYPSSAKMLVEKRAGIGFRADSRWNGNVVVPDNLINDLIRIVNQAERL